MAKYTYDEVQDASIKLLDFIVQNNGSNVLDGNVSEIVAEAFRLLKVSVKYNIELDSWITKQMAVPNVNKDVVVLLSKLHFNHDSSISNALSLAFNDGFCYHFALMLKSLFNRGKICLAYPRLHIVWQDDNGVAYDINGVYTEHIELVDITNNEDIIRGFTHLASDDEYVEKSHKLIEYLFHELRIKHDDSYSKMLANSLLKMIR